MESTKSKWERVFRIDGNTVDDDNAGVDSFGLELLADEGDCGHLPGRKSRPYRSKR